MPLEDSLDLYPVVGGSGMQGAIAGLPEAMDAFNKYQRMPGLSAPTVVQTIYKILNSTTLTEQQKRTTLAGLQANMALNDADAKVLLNLARGTPLTEQELKELYGDKEEEQGSLEPDTDLTPQQTFEGLEEEQKIKRINDALENNPNATLANILDILTRWNIPTDLFRKATGTTPEEYVGKGDAGTDDGTDGGTDGGDGGTGDGECQPGYERWNGSCVLVCNAAAGYVRDEDPSSPSYGSCVLMDGGGNGGDDGGDDGKTCATGYVYDEALQKCVPKKTDNGTNKSCPIGQVYDEASQSCVPIKKEVTGGDGGDNGKTCPTGYVYDEASQSCVPIKEEVTGGDGGGGDLNDPIEKPTLGLPQQPTTETTTDSLFAAFAASPNRTTSEVLAPELFKLDNNIPLVGKLTQYTPMAAPQYLLSGISQRYRV